MGHEEVASHGFGKILVGDLGVIRLGDEHGVPVLVALGQEEKIGKTREDKGYDKVSYPRTINIRGNK